MIQKIQEAFYHAGIAVYHSLIRIASMYHGKARAWIQGRRDWVEKLSASLPAGKKVVWIHCASLGEWEQGKPVIRLIKKNYPDTFVLLSFFSPSGYLNVKPDGLYDMKVYLPIDTRENARRWVSLIQPQTAIFVKYEFWYHYLKTLNAYAIPVYLISAHFPGNQIFFKWYGGFFRTMLHFFTWMFVEDTHSAALLNKHGFSRVTVTGNCRIDRVWEVKERGRRWDALEVYSANSRVFIAGSTWQKDEQILLPLINSAPEGWRFIVAPHDIDPDRIMYFEKQLKVASCRWTTLVRKGLNPASFQVLIIDVIGMLASLYRYGHVAYVGGGFGKGIHSVLEPAVFGLPVITGPAIGRFHEAVSLHQQGGLFIVKDKEELIETFNNLITRQLLKPNKACLGYIEANRGAAGKIFHAIEHHFKSPVSH